MFIFFSVFFVFFSFVAIINFTSQKNIGQSIIMTLDSQRGKNGLQDAFEHCYCLLHNINLHKNGEKGCSVEPFASSFLSAFSLFRQHKNGAR
jgi:hypothetical protein